MAKMSFWSRGELVVSEEDVCFSRGIVTES